MSSEIRVNKINNRVGLGTVSFTDTGPVVSGIVTASLGLRVPDNVYSYFGTGNDLSIRHDAAGGNHSYIFNTGAGVLKIGSNTQFLIGKTTNVTYIEANPDGDVKLYHNNSSKLATTSTGITVTGTVSDTIGDVRKLGMNAQSGNYTLVASDSGKFIRRTGGNITINPSIFSTGDMVTILNDTGGNITIIQGSSFSLINSADASTGNRTLAQRGMATILLNAQNQGYISGSGLS